MPVAEQVVRCLAGGGLTLSLAESCTGGLVAHALTNVPGSSEVFLLCAVTYSNRAKEKVLGVPVELLASWGAVSGPVAEAMAAGVRDVAGSDLGVSVTGIAGPSGGSPEKPVGTVWFGYATPDGVSSEMKSFHGSRLDVKTLSAGHALDWIRRYCCRER